MLRSLKTFKYFFGLLLCLEAILQVTSVFYSYTHDKLKNTSNRKIIFLGESTTANNFNESNYPDLLNEILISKNKDDFEFINLARPGADSTAQIKELKKYLDENPNGVTHVISMLGINDQFYYSEKTKNIIPIYLQERLLNIRLYKLFVLFISDLNLRSIKPFVVVEKEWTKRIEIFSKFLSKRKPLSEQKEESLIEIIRYIETNMHMSTKEDCLSRNTNLPHSKITDAYFDTLSLLRLRMKENKNIKSIIPFLEKGSSLNPCSSFFYYQLSGVYDELGERGKSHEYKKKIDMLEKSQMIEVTRDNLIRLSLLTKERSIELWHVQYPLMSNSPQKNLLKSFSHVRFIENKENFESELKKSNYESLFHDRFAGYFGHCTEKGNRLIAENIYKQIFEKRPANK